MYFAVAYSLKWTHNFGLKSFQPVHPTKKDTYLFITVTQREKIPTLLPFPGFCYGKYFGKNDFKEIWLALIVYSTAVDSSAKVNRLAVITKYVSYFFVSQS